MFGNDEIRRNVAHIISGAVSAATERSILAESVLGYPTLSQNILWADAVSRSARDTNQPRPWLVSAARKAAFAAYETLPDREVFAVATSWASRLGSTAAEIVHPGEWRDYLDRVHEHACTASAAEADRSRWARELAAGLIEERVDTSPISRELGQMHTRTGKIDPLTMSTTYLRPVRRKFVTVIPVLGAKGMGDIGKLSIAADIRVLKGTRFDGSYSRWGASGGSAAEFVRRVSEQAATFGSIELVPAPKLFIEVETEASDIRAAAEKALSRTQFILDNYHAAHPTIEISVYGAVGTAPLQSTRNVFDIKSVRKPSVDGLTLLGVRDSSALAATKRINSLARSSAPTVTRAAFSWVAIEAAGIKPSEIENCARLLSLLEARQLFFTSYRSVVRFAHASTHAEKRIKVRRRVLERRAKKLEVNAPLSKTPELLRLRAMRLRVATAMHARLEVLERNSSSRGRQLLESLQVGKATGQYGDPSFATLGEFDKWARTVRLWSNEPTHDDADALKELSLRMSAGEKMHLEQFATLAASPEQTKTWLETQKSHFRAQLCALYAARNLHLHTGAYDLLGETLLAYSGQALADALIEVWTFWSVDDETNTPHETVSTLSARYEDILNRLSSGTRLESCSMGDVMSPSWQTSKSS